MARIPSNKAGLSVSNRIGRARGSDERRGGYRKGDAAIGYGTVDGVSETQCQARLGGFSRASLEREPHRWPRPDFDRLFGPSQVLRRGCKRSARESSSREGA